MNNIFKKDDIKAGYLLRVKEIDEDREFNMTVVPTTEFEPHPLQVLRMGAMPRADGDLACCNPGKDWWPPSHFDDELTSNDEYQVVAVYGYTPPKFLLDNTTEDRELLWEREQDEAPVEDPKAEDDKPLNCKVVCISNEVPGRIACIGFTVGKVYEVKDGRITSNWGWVSNVYNDIQSLTDAIGNQFIEFVE